MLGHEICNALMQTAQGRQTIDKLLQEYENIIQSYKTASKVSTIVTDNAKHGEGIFAARV